MSMRASEEEEADRQTACNAEIGISCAITMTAISAHAKMARQATAHAQENAAKSWTKAITKREMKLRLPNVISQRMQTLAVC